MLTGFISFDSTDSSSATELHGYGHLLFSAFQSAGGFLPCGHKTKELEAIKQGAANWTAWITENVMHMSIGNLPEIMPMFDLIHRIAYNRAAPESFTRRWTDKYIQAWLRDDKDVSLLDVTYIVGKKILQDKGAVHYQIRNKFFKLISGWVHDGLKQHSYERLRQVAILLRADLSELVSEPEAYKSYLAEKNIGHLSGTFSAMDASTLKACREFAYELFPGHITSDQLAHYDKNLLQALSMSRDLNRWDRMAYGIEANRAG